MFPVQLTLPFPLHSAPASRRLSNAMTHDPPPQSAETPAPATLQDIAVHCGVARVTVWRALHGDRKRMSAETYARILATAQALQYDVSLHQAARALVNRRTGKRVENQVIALMFPRAFHREYFHQIFQGILDSLVALDYGVLCYHAGYAQTPLPIALRRGDVDGLIMYETIDALPVVCRKLRADSHFGDRPLLTLMMEAPGCSAVVTDDCAGGCAAAGHLLDLGHRHLLWHLLDHPAHHRRAAGFRQAYRARGLDPAAYLHPVVWTSDMTHNHTLQAELLRAHPEITGILAPLDDEAIYAYHQVQEMGKRVPDDISIVGYDDTDPLPDRRGRNLLTTVRLPLAEVGRQAAQLILRRIAGEAPDDVTITLPVELVVRKTTAPPPPAR